MSVNSTLIPSIEREQRICDLAIADLKATCRVFEKRYTMPSDEFYERFAAGELGDEEDFFEWKALVEGIRRWEESKTQLGALMK